MSPLALDFSSILKQRQCIDWGLDNIIFISSFQEFASWLSPDVKFVVGKVYPFAVSPKHLGFIIVTKEKKNDQTKFEDVKLGLYNLREAI